MKKNVFMVLRILLGLVLLIFGTNKFFHFIPDGTMPMPDAAGMDFLGALGATGYMFYVIGGIEVVVGLYLLLNRCITTALLLFAPIIVNIFLFHVFLDPSGFLTGTLITVIYLLLVYENRKSFKPLFKK